MDERDCLWKDLSPQANPVKAKTFIGFLKPKQQQKTQANLTQGGARYQLQEAEELVSFGCVVLTLEKDRGKGLQTLPPWLRKGSKAKCLEGQSLPGSPQKALCESVKVKPGLCWRPQDVRNSRVTGYLQREVAPQSVEIAQERSVLQLTKMRGAGRSEEHFDKVKGIQTLAQLTSQWKYYVGFEIQHITPAKMRKKQSESIKVHTSGNVPK